MTIAILSRADSLNIRQRSLQIRLPNPCSVDKKLYTLEKFSDQLLLPEFSLSGERRQASATLAGLSYHNSLSYFGIFKNEKKTGKETNPAAQPHSLLDLTILN